MNYKTLILTLALCLCIVPFASAAHDYYPENKIVDTNPALSVPDPATYGYVVFNIIAGGAQDKTVWVINKANVNAKPFDCKFNPDKSERVGQNPDYTPIEVPGVGTTGILQWQSGSYTAYLQNGNGNQCERRDFIVGGASSSQATQVVFQGAAVSQLGKVDIGTTVKEDKICILFATYGMKKKVCSEPSEVSKKSRPPRCEWVGGYDIVTHEVKTVVDMGYDSFVFSNGWSGNYEGGIYDDSISRNLLQAINDPAKDQVKEVYILYMKNGHLHSHTWAEYETISL